MILLTVCRNCIFLRLIFYNELMNFVSMDPFAKM